MHATSSLCFTCRSLGLLPSDFVHDGCDDGETFMGTEGTDEKSYGIMCDGYAAKLMSPCTLYRCSICNRGQYDLCEACHWKSRHCQDQRQVLHRRRTELLYHDRCIDGATDDQAGIPQWNGLLGTIQDVRQRVSCPLCRLALRLVRETTNPDVSANGLFLDEPDNKTRISLY